MKRTLAAAVTLGLMIAIVWGAGERSSSNVRAGRLSEQTWDELVPEGKEVDAIYGDYALKNDYLVAVIADPLPTRNANMTVRDVAGALIDLTTTEQASDQLSAFYPGRRAFPFREAEIRSGESREPFNGDGLASDGVCEVVVRADAADGKPAVETIYRLGKEDRWLTVISRYTNRSDEPISFTLEDDIRADGQKEDMLKSANGEHELFWIHDRFWNQAYGVTAETGSITSNSNPRSSELRYESGSETAGVTLPPGETHELTRYVYAAPHLPGVRAAAARHAGEDLETVELTVKTADGRPLPQGMVELTREGAAYGAANLPGDGTLSLELPAGDYQLAIASLGVSVTPSPLAIRVSADDSNEFTIEPDGWRPGTVAAKITDREGGPLPAKVQFLPIGDTPTPDWGPETAEYAVRNVRYAPRGTFEQPIPAGRYEVIISRGPEYDVVFTELTVPPGETVTLEEQLTRSVDTPGWVSTDFHSHSSPSGDNTSSQLGRVINLVCEHIEFAPCTEHNRVSTYEPHIARLGIEDHMATVSGMELTGQPLPLNHQNVFPLIHRPRTQDGGAPTTDPDPEAQVERLALWDDRSEKLIQQNHPDLGRLFFDKNGDGQRDDGFSRSFPFIDIIEIHPVQAAIGLSHQHSSDEDRAKSRMFRWVQLLNQGQLFPGIVNTDAHYNYHGSGWLRNWIRSSTDDPGRIDSEEMRIAAEGGQLVMSNGPFLEVKVTSQEAPEGVTAGQSLAAAGGKVRLSARVQCPNWFKIDRVFLLVNGREAEAFSFSKSDDPGQFRSGTVQFEESADLELDEDAHLIVVAAGVNEKLGPVVGPGLADVPPTAISNPIYVDVDGGGFKPNGDTLGLPLPPTP